MKITLYFAQEKNSDTEFIEFLSAFKQVFNNNVDNQIQIITISQHISQEY